jgi:hypothetical protein
VTDPRAGALTPELAMPRSPVPRVLMRFREDATRLLAMPWSTTLEEWPAQGVTFVALPVGESRHVVRFVGVGPDILAFKELPVRPARREYDVMRELEARGAPAVKAIGLVERPDEDAAILVTRYLARSLQLRRLFRRLPEAARRHRELFLDAMTSLLVELHRGGIYWGDCSLANTLLLRDGPALQAYLVDAETSEVHGTLSEGQRYLDVGLAVENLAGDLLDIAAASGRTIDEAEDDLAAAQSLRDRYERLWSEIHDAEPIRPDERYRVEARLRRLNALGFVVEEVILEPGSADRAEAKLRVAVGSRRFHASRLRQLTGLDVREGQATVLLNDLAAWAGFSAEVAEGPANGDLGAPDSPFQRAARRWLLEVFEPTLERIRARLGPDADPIQAYCDLLEVRWLLSEEAGHDVGTDAALDRMASHLVPVGSAAGMAVAEEPAGVRLAPQP